MSSGFYGLLRNLRSAMRTGPDFGRLFSKLGCNHCFGNDGVIRRWHGCAKLGCSRRFGNDGVAVKMARSAIA